MKRLGWTVLALVFVDELLAMAAAYVWGEHVAGWLLGVVAALVVVAVWSLFASPTARYGGPVVRLVVKALVFGLTSAGVWVVGHHTAGLLLLVLSAAVNAAAQAPVIKSLAEQSHPAEAS